MTGTNRPFLLYGIVALLFLANWYFLGLNSALFTLNFCLISAVMALGVNIQWGYAGLFNVGVMGFAAVGGLMAVLVSYPPVAEAWAAGDPYKAAGLFDSVSVSEWKKVVG